MFASSRVLDPALPPGARRTVQAGTALFLVSDSVLAVQKFLLAEPRPVLESVVMATYTTAQGLIAAGVARSTGPEGGRHRAGGSGPAERRGP